MQTSPQKSLSTREWEQSARAGVSPARIALTFGMPLEDAEAGLCQAERRLEARRREADLAEGGPLPTQGELMTPVLIRDNHIRSNCVRRLRA